jgi:aspartate/methionine/tyrosine aminotransferase
VPEIFAKGSAFVEGYKRYIRECRDIAVDCLAGCDFVPPEGGFYVTVRLQEDEEEAALRLLRDQHVLVHPGYFYDIAPNHLVMTYIQDAANLRKAFSAIAELARG